MWDKTVTSCCVVVFMWRNYKHFNSPSWLKLSKSTFVSSLSNSLLLGEPPPFIDLKYWLQRVRPASFFNLFSLARLWVRSKNGVNKKKVRTLWLIAKQSLTHLFWNQTWTTRMSSPVSCDNCSRTCRAGFGLLLYALLRVSNCFAVIVVRGRLFEPSPSNEPSDRYNEAENKYQFQ